MLSLLMKPGDRKKIPAMQAAFFPTFNIMSGKPVAFFVREFNSKIGNEVRDFGDGSPEICVKSDFVLKKDAAKERKFA
ncbi:MAG: hypothetical protein ABIJ42_10255 [Acidobacteriota bacterium]